VARKRQIDPIYPLEQEIAQLTIPARYFYIMSWCHMDDANGVMPYDTFLLKGQIFPADNVNVEDLIQECIKARRLFPFEAEGKHWLWCPTLLKHQHIQHPSRRSYPAPPKQVKELYTILLTEPSLSPHIPLTQSRVELSRVELNKEQPSEKLKSALDKVYKDGFNIYKLLERLKKELKWEPGRLFPEEVLLKVCDSYAKNKAGIKDQWAWFKTAIRKASEEYFAIKNIEEHRQIKSQPAMSLAEIFKVMK